MNVIHQAMFFMLDAIHSWVFNYGWAVVILTVLIRVVLWPLNSAQTRSMRKMQELQPKLKALQEKFKDNPEKLREQMMKFYSEHSFNPLAGCLPMLIQLPIFIGLYGVLSSPHFLAASVNEQFLFVNSLSHTLRTHAGPALDGAFNVQRDDAFTLDKQVVLIMPDGTRRAFEVKDPGKAVAVTPKPVLPGMPLTMTLDLNALGLSDDYRALIEGVEGHVVNVQSQEVEKVTFDNQSGTLTQSVPTAAGDTKFNMDVLTLIVIYGILTMGYQKVMMARQPKASGDDPASMVMQSPAMKFLPLMFVVLLFFIPIPAGALIYLVVTTFLMLVQTVWVNLQEDRKALQAQAKRKPSEQVLDVKAE